MIRRQDTVDFVIMLEDIEDEIVEDAKREVKKFVTFTEPITNIPSPKIPSTPKEPKQRKPVIVDLPAIPKLNDNLRIAEM